MSAHFTTPTDELLLLAETLGEVKTKADKLEAEFATQARPLEAATNALSAALSGIKALQFHVLDNNLGALSARVEEMRKAVDEQVGVIALELKKADETNAAKAGQEAEALRSEIAALQAQLGTLGAQFSAQLERVEFSAKEEAKKLQLIPGPAGAAGASLNPRGTFVDGETYNRLDVVSWLGSSYIAAVDGVTEKPSKNSNQWQVLASRGGGAAGGAGDFGSLAGVAQINQGGTGQTTRAAGLNALLPSQTGNVQYMLLTDGAGTVSWGAQPVAGLPSQTSNGGKLLTTDGTNASWSNAVTVSGNNATVTGTLTVNSTLTANGPASGITVNGAGITMDTDPVGASASLRFVDGATPRFWIYKLSGDSNLYIRDMTNSRMQARFNPSSTSSTAITSFYSKVEIDATTASTTTSTGALVVGNGTSGGLGVGGAINCGGNIVLSPASVAASGEVGNLRIADSSNTNRKLFFGLDNTVSPNGVGYIQSTLTGTTTIPLQLQPLGGSLSVGNSGTVVTLNGTTASTTTSTGALVVGNGTSGGLGVGGAITAGGGITSTNPGGVFQITGTGNTGASKELIFYRSDGGDTLNFGLTGSAYAGILTGLGNNEAYFYYSSSSAFRIFLGTAATQRYDFTANQFKINQTTASTSTSSGALVVSGGVGVAGAIVTGGIVRCGGSNGLSLGSDTGNIRIDSAGPAGVEFRGLSAADTITGFTMREMALIDGTTAPSTRAGYATIYVDSADGDLKVKFGDGTVKTIATDS